MKKKKIIGIAIFLVLAGSLYFYFFSKPIVFISEEELIKAVNNYYHDGPERIEIQDVIFLGDTHVFVPFTSNGRYGTSYWVWKKRSWKLGEISTIQTPMIWKVDPKDPSTYVFVWNINPDNDMTQLDFYLENRRNYRVSNEVHRYTPRVQLDYRVKFAEDGYSYGVKNLPSDWITFLNSYNEVENSKQQESSMFSFFPQNSVNFAWRPLDENGELSFPTFVSGTGSGSGQIHLYYLSNIHDYDLE
ncbi:hypothetical protein DS745_23115 [Anaerobacillus alkaliphilus]|uniref:Uncharacterized protein n=1 Tax=Anaerobacillus alkaliphilus TaxID=1548597 RepID=A0A4Q0VQF9_9BACI|nr:hypothetical protein [Anaerobacillus alkaliphilus]RXI96595.1 hypothetical protein DS745_23115 [Anaerobacillus alkaliphilus]